MKEKRLILAAALLCLSALSSVSFGGSWVAPSLPTDKAQTIQDDNIYYLLNLKAGQFLTEGNDWGTRTSLGATGLQFKVNFKQLSSEGEKLYSLKDSSVAKSAWLNMFIIDMSYSYVDMASQGHQYWSLTEKTTGVYTIQVPDTDAVFGTTATGGVTYFGWKNDGSTIVYPLVSMDDEGSANYGIEWAFIPKADYLLYQAKCNLYKGLNDAEYAGVTTDDALAVYNNAQSTINDFDTATAKLAERVKNSKFDGAKADHPCDVTVAITNPDFAVNDAGWSKAGTDKSRFSYESQVLECWNSHDFDLYQVDRNLPAGVYRLTVKGFSRYGGYVNAASARATGKEVSLGHLYANADSTELCSIFEGAGTDGTIGVNTSYGYVPNSKSDAKSYFDNGAYGGNSLLFALDSDTLRLGIRKWYGLGDDWIIFSNFKLAYYGSESDAYKLILKEAMDQTTAYADVKMGTDVKKTLQTATAAGQTLLDDAAAQKSAILAAKANIMDALVTVKASIKAYQTLSASITDGDSFLSSYESNDLSDLWLTLPGLYDEGSLTTDECYMYADSISKLIKEGKANAVKVGDCTYLIQNPGFDPDGTSWTQSSGNGGTGNSEIEFFDQVFDLHQTLKGIPNGRYTLQCKGFLRCGGNDVAAAGYTAGTNKLLAKFYANSSETPIKDIMSQTSPQQLFNNGTWMNDYQHDGVYTPNSVLGARAFFDNGYYAGNTVSTVVTDHTLTFGVRMTEKPAGSCWCIVDDFTMQYDGSSYDVLKTDLDALRFVADSLKNLPMCADSLNALKASITEAENASTDAMKPLADLNYAIPAAQKSIATYAQLADELTKVEQVINSAEAGTAADNLSATYSSVSDKYTSGSYADADIPVAVEELQAALTVYRAALLHLADASSTNPIDATSLIVNPDFSSGKQGWNDAGSTMWDNSEQSEMEQWNRTFDTYQILYGVPNGTYKFTAQGFYRDGSYAPAAALFNSNSEELNALLYANEVSSPLMSIFAGRIAESTEDTYVEVSVPINTNATSFVPNRMTSARLSFDSNLYKGNEVTVNVTDNTLRIGVKKSVVVGDDWTVFDSFQLIYYGATSNGVAVSTLNILPLKQEFYTINGMRIARLVKGLNIVKSYYSNGKVQVRKQIVK